jgi:uncharacterized protein YjbI with pentapeptide repeats
MMLLLLARTAAVFEKRLKATLLVEADRERYRARVENALFLQLLVGMKSERAGGNGVLLAIIALITIVLAPLATLILMQMMFLPDHSFRMTWWHRTLVVTDLALIIVMSLRYFALFPRLDRQWNEIALAANLNLIGVAVLWLSLAAGQWAGENLIGRANFDSTANGVVFGLFPDRLILEDEIIVGESRLEESTKEIASRGGTGFVPTRNFDDRDLQAAVLSGADLRGVSLRSARLQGADLSTARLDGAFLSGAQLQGAVFRNAWLQGANLFTANLQDADFFHAQLQGARLTIARLQGASFKGAQLQGAELIGAQLQGADLSDAQLQGANLYQVQLQGAELIGAQLQGAELDQAQLQGADLRGAEMADGELDGTFVFRTDITNANLSTSTIASVQADRVKLSDVNFISLLLSTPANETPLLPADVGNWIAAATEFAAEKDKAGIAGRFARLKTDFQEEPKQVKWPGLKQASLALDPDGAEHRLRLATILGDLACDADASPYVARALIASAAMGLLTRKPSSRLAAIGDQLDRVRDRMKAARKAGDSSGLLERLAGALRIPKLCPGVAGFTEDDWRRLEAIKPE